MLKDVDETMSIDEAMCKVRGSREEQSGGRKKGALRTNQCTCLPEPCLITSIYLLISS